jgi:hypothetical protein
MVSSLLFGETCAVLESQEDWLRVRCDFDAYEGWIPDNYLEDAGPDMQGWNKVLAAQSAVLMRDSYRIHLSAGSNIPDSDEIIIRNEPWRLTIRDPNIALEPWQIAKGFLQVPYLWGGRSDCGMDCSGLVQVVFKIKGQALPRDSSEQAKTGKDISFGDHLPNDLAFFENANGKITHVGVVSKSGFIHASGRVREDDLIAEGIVCRDNGKLTHKLTSIKRLPF